MQIRVEDVSPVEKKLIVEVPWDTVSAKLGEAYRELGKGVALKGFRKGKAPRAVLEQLYGPRVQLEVASDLVRESFYRGVAEHKLAAVAEPRNVEGGQIKKGEPLHFSAIVEVKAEIEPKDYTGMPLERRKLAIADETVEKALTDLQREHTELVPIEGRDTTQAGDVVALSITGTIGEHPVDQKRFVVDLDDKEREPVPGLYAALTGAPIATKDRELELPVGDDWKDESLRGRTAKLTVSILEARAKDVPALDDEFAKDTGRAETLDGLRAKLREDIETHEKEHIQRECREAALKELVTRNQIPVASALVDRAVEIQWNRLRAMLGMQQGQGPAMTDEMREKMLPGATDEVRGQLLLDAIADKEQLQVTEAELETHVANAAKMRNVPPARLRAEWERDGKLDSARWTLRQDKVLDFLVEKAAITEVDKPSPHEPHDAEHHHG
ncbi:MAG TPA: trigger factor [Kofleriaceae bacterium]|nr:trigger factor [Kofleriaceae bacterium]